MAIAPFRLERFFSTREFTAPWLLCASDCESITVGDLLAMEPGAADALLELRLGYTHSQGDPELRRLVAAQYDRIGEEEVLVHAGAQEAVLTTMAALLERGDHVVVHAPSYQSLSEVARWLGADVTAWRADAARGWSLDVDELRAAIRPNTRAIVINSPHSPTGWQMPRATLDAVVAVAREHGLVLFSDEVYRGLEYDAGDRLPAACDLYERAVSLGVLSKSYGLAGLRLGWIATRDAALLAGAAATKDYTTICTSAPSEALARVALRNAERIVARNRGIIAHNLALLDDFMATHAGRIEWVRPRAGPVAFPRIPSRPDVAALCEQVLAESGVLLLPGTTFDERSDAFRIGFGRRDFPDALARFGEWLAATKGAVAGGR